MTELGAAYARSDAVWRIYRRRGNRTSTSSRLYALYVAAVVLALYGAPMVLLIGPEVPRISEILGTAPLRGIGYLSALGTVWAALLIGRWWGPLTTVPFILHVLAATDLRPDVYLQRIALRRLGVVLVGVGLPLSVAGVVLCDAAGNGRWAGAAGGSMLLLLASACAAWLWGQARPLAAVWWAAAGVGVLLTLGWLCAEADLMDGIAVFALVGGERVSTPAIWSGLAVQLGVACVAFTAALRSVRTVDLNRLRRESGRASSAQAYVATGTFHEALELYRPEPRGQLDAMIRGRLLRGHLARGIVRALRTPARTGVGALLLIGGSTAVATTIPLAWALGAVAVYLGCGWISETWRSVRDEMTLPPLLGTRWGGPLRRHLAWPMLATWSSGVVGLVVVWLAGDLSARAVVAVVSVHAVALSARFLREMKLLLPVQLLTPVVTPYGDVAAIRVLLWQFDGLLIVLLTASVQSGIDLPILLVVIAAAVATWCWTRAHHRVREP